MSDSPDPPPLKVRWPKAGRPLPQGTKKQSVNQHPDGEDALLMAAAEPTLDFNTTHSVSGTCIHAVNGVELVADPSGVAYWPATDTVIVADLHLEKGSSFARRGQLLPPHDTMTTLRRLEAALAAWQPTRVIALGDSFHDEEAAARLSNDAVEKLDGLMSGREWVWIAGNHDPKPPNGLPGTCTDEMREGGLILRHEPAIEDCLGEIAGHLHPKARLLRRGRIVRRACFAASRSRMILPSFGAYTGGLNVFHSAFDGLFEGRQFHALMCGKDQVYRISAKHLC